MAAPFLAPTKAYHTKVYDKIDPKRPELSCKGKNVLVTGGGIGIGAAVVRSFAEAGASTIGILGRTESALIETKESIESDFKSTKVIVLVADLIDGASVTKALNHFNSSAGLIDVLVHNAAYMSDLVPIADANVDEWFKSFEVGNETMWIIFQAKLIKHYNRSTSKALLSLQKLSCLWRPRMPS
jgi:NADP-dependent 3-hydroxy acid dehydrogenase YdfG